MASSNRTFDPFNVRGTFRTTHGEWGIYRLSRLEDQGLTSVGRLPYSIRILLEAVLRTCDGFAVTEEDVLNVAGWNASATSAIEIPLKPARVLLQDFTGVPAVVDLAAMRSAMQRLGGDPAKINPLIPVDLVIDHSIQVDFFGTPDALQRNVELEFQRNRERYEFLRWGQKAFSNFRVVPPNVGIVHQVNLEYLARGVFIGKDAAGPVAYPDSLVGTDSHTTMINGMGVLGWGVGGIEAEAVMLGQPLYFVLPQVVGFELTGRLSPAATATDLVLTVTQMLRQEGVVGKFVEFFGTGVSSMSLADRATIANMAPEYGATMGYFPMDQETLRYLKRTGRDAAQVDLVEHYAKEQQLFRTDEAPVPTYSKVLRLDLGTVEPSLAGPKRPQDRVPLARMKTAFREALKAPLNQRGFQLPPEARERRVTVSWNGLSSQLTHGSVVIAAITSCTNTSNASVMMAAGLLAKKAVERGLHVPPHVKTSLAPGSRVVTEYFRRAGLAEPLGQLGFHVVGYGCTTCIGNSGPLPEPVAQAVQSADLVVAAVLSGNRNFEGRINPAVRANYLASPPLVVAYALAGTVDIDLLTEPLAKDDIGREVYLHEIWPTPEEVAALIDQCVQPELFAAEYARALEGSPEWHALPAPESLLYPWNPQSTYIQEPPFLVNVSAEPQPIRPIRKARVLALLGDSITTDHISPAGSISQDSPAGKYLIEQGVPPHEFNSYGARRGNDRVMVRGTFANVRIRNHLAPGTEGGYTRYLPDGAITTIYEAATQYQQQGVPLLVIAGSEYGTGSSRDWAAKGTYLLGVRAVIAASYERIHRSNLVGMGVLPLEFAPGTTWQSLGITGEETYDIEGLDETLQPRAELRVHAVRPDGTSIVFPVQVRIDTPIELEYYRHGGILPYVLRKLLAEK